MENHVYAPVYNYRQLPQKSGYTSDWQTYFQSCQKTVPQFVPSQQVLRLNPSSIVKPMYPFPGLFDAFNKNALPIVTGTNFWPDEHLLAFWQEYRPKAMRICKSSLEMVPWFRWESHAEYFLTRLAKIINGPEALVDFQMRNDENRDRKYEEWAGQEYRFMEDKSGNLFFINYSHLWDSGVDTPTFLKNLDMLLNDKGGLGPQSHDKDIMAYWRANRDLDPNVHHALIRTQQSLEDTKMPGVLSNGEIFVFMDLIDGKFVAHVCNPMEDMKKAKGDDEKALSTVAGSLVAFAFYCMEKKGKKFGEGFMEEVQKHQMLNEKLKEEPKPRDVKDMV